MSKAAPSTHAGGADATAAPAAAGAARSELQTPEAALETALERLLGPVAHLAVARGLTFAAVQELLKRAFVDAAGAAHPGLAAHRKVSRIATTTGINRREVTRLTARARRSSTAEPPALRGPARSLASELCAHWRTANHWRGADGEPSVLPRLGAAPSFEALAHEITRDVHPRSLLDELCRLGLARHDAVADTVCLEGEAFVPSGDHGRMLGFLGANVGDHLRAAVDNVLANGRPPHLEQALFAEGLSPASLEALRPLLREQWSQLRQALVPALEACIEADAQAPGPRARLRLGLYAYQEPPPADGGDGGGAASPVSPASAADPAPAARPAAPRARRMAARRPHPAGKEPEA